MSKWQELIIMLAEKLESGEVTAEGLRFIAKLLNGIPSCYHEDAIRAAFGEVEEDA